MSPAGWRTHLCHDCSHCRKSLMNLPLPTRSAGFLGLCFSTHRSDARIEASQMLRLMRPSHVAADLMLRRCGQRWTVLRGRGQPVLQAHGPAQALLPGARAGARAPHMPPLGRAGHPHQSASCCWLSPCRTWKCQSRRPPSRPEHRRPTQHVCRHRSRTLTQDAPPNTRSCCSRHLSRARRAA